MSRVVFSLTEQQIAILTNIDRGNGVSYRESRTVNVLVHRGLVQWVEKRHGRSCLLTPIGKAAVSLAALLASPGGRS